MFDNEQMLDVAVRRLDGTTVVDPAQLAAGGRRATPPLPVSEALTPILPDGLRRGSTVTVTGSVSLLLALLGEASARGAWCALVGFPRISGEAAREYGVELGRLAVIPSAAAEHWTTAVGALLDAVDVVAARPPRLAPGDIRRLAARARTRDAVLVPFLTGSDVWPGADVRLTARGGHWSGIGTGSGRLTARKVEVRAEGRGAAARPRVATLWLPASGGGVRAADPVDDRRAAPVIELAG